MLKRTTWSAPPMVTAAGVAVVLDVVTLLMVTVEMDNLVDMAA